MRSHMVTAVIVLLVLFGSTARVSALAQVPGRGTTLVCIHTPGGSLAVEEWTPDQVADYEDRFGRDVAEIAVNPVTGECANPAGLVGGWSPGTSWLCTPQTAGTWSGPDWVQAQLQHPDQVPPDPAIGRCPDPVRPEEAEPAELEQAAAITVHLTELAVTGQYDRLYAWMHPDAQAIVPREVVAGWYREVFGWYPEMIAIRAPTSMTVDAVQLEEWTWGVTGRVYPSAAAVSVRQRFADGVETDGVVWLVRDHGVWRWFFGRDRTFVDEQIARFREGSQAADGVTEDYVITDLGVGGNGSSATAINEAGDILGSWPAFARPGGGAGLEDFHEVLWTDGTLVDLTERGIGWATGFDGHGDVIGHPDVQHDNWLVYRVNTGKVEPMSPPVEPAVVPPPGFAGGSVVATNARGDQAGNLIDAWGENDPRQDRAFVRVGGEMVVLDAAPGGTSSHATDINEAGLVVGGPAAPGPRGRDPGRAFLFDPEAGTMADLGTLPGHDNSVAWAINTACQVVGYSWGRQGEGAPEAGAFLYDHRTGLMSDLNDLIPPESGWTRLWAPDINDAGQIVGQGWIDGEMHAFVLTPTSGGVATPWTPAPLPRVARGLEPDAAAGTCRVAIQQPSVTPDDEAPRPLAGDAVASPVTGSVSQQQDLAAALSPPAESIVYADPARDTAAYDIRDLGAGHGTWSSAQRVNEQGQILWTWATSQDPMADPRFPPESALFTDTHEALWVDGTTTDLTARGIEQAVAITDEGTVLGRTWASEPGGGLQDLLYDVDLETVTPFLEIGDVFPIALSDTDTVAGTLDGNGVIVTEGRIIPIPLPPVSEVVPPGARRVDPVAINASGHVAGTTSVDVEGDEVRRAVLFANGILTILDAAPGAESSSASDINDVDQVVGNPLGSPGGQAFLYDHTTGTSTDIGTLPGYQNITATAINNVGQVVGHAWFALNWLPGNETDQIQRAFIYDHRTRVMADLNERLPRGSGWYLVDALDINDAGQIVGRGLICEQMHGFVLTPTNATGDA
jgi:probable HAF family extracellular repeat protein